MTTKAQKLAAALESSKAVLQDLQDAMPRFEVKEGTAQAYLDEDGDVCFESGWLQEENALLLRDWLTEMFDDPSPAGTTEATPPCLK